MQQVAGSGAHVAEQATGLAGPDADGQQHDVARGEGSHRQGADQRVSTGVLGSREGLGVEWHQVIAKRFDCADQAVGAVGGATPDQAEAARGHVDAALDHVGFAGEDGFDQPDAGTALQAVDGEDQLMGAVFAG